MAKPTAYLRYSLLAVSDRSSRTRVGAAVNAGAGGNTTEPFLGGAGEGEVELPLDDRCRFPRRNRGLRSSVWLESEPLLPRLVRFSLRDERERERRGGVEADRDRVRAERRCRRAGDLDEDAELRLSWLGQRRPVVDAERERLRDRRWPMGLAEPVGFRCEPAS